MALLNSGEVRAMNLIKILLALSLVVLFLLFIAQNAGYVEVSFFYTAYKVPLFVLLLFSFTFRKGQAPYLDIQVPPAIYLVKSKGPSGLLWL